MADNFTNNPDSYKEQKGAISKVKGILGQCKIGFIVLALGAAITLYGIFSSAPPKVDLDAPPVIPVDVPSIPEESTKSIPENALYITAQRQQYKSGQLVLRIPRMGVDAAIQSSVTEKALNRGPGLYDYSELPGEGNKNVSISGHRDVAGAIFYYIDRMSEGDLFYLIYNKQIYVYSYKDTKIVEKTDWNPIMPQGYSCLTLVSCHPVRTTRQRIVVTAELERIDPYTKNYDYKPWKEGYDKPYAWSKDAKSWNDGEDNTSSETDSSAPLYPELGILP